MSRIPLPHAAWVSRLSVLVLLCATNVAGLARADDADKATVPVGAAEIDITPDYPVRMAGYYNRKTESEGVEQRLKAKALAIGGDTGGGSAGPVVLVTVDNCGVPAHVTDEVARRLKARLGLPRERFVVSSSHTHSAPALAGALTMIVCPPFPPEQREHMNRYTRELTDKLEQVAIQALEQRRPGRLAWGQGTVGFAVNRRPYTKDRQKVDRIGINAGGPVDRTMPLLRVVGADGMLKAVVVNYACHCTTLGGDLMKLCGDWAGYASEAIESAHPGVIALVTIGCGADANPNPRGTLQNAKDNGAAIAKEADRLLRLEDALTPLASGGATEAHLSRIEIPFGALPTRQEWEAKALKPGAVGVHAQANLARLDRGEALPTSLPYVVQTWSFGEDLAMIFLAGEVVVDYALRLKAECNGSRLWISAYCNDVPCYIASRRVIGEGGYEVDSSMLYYDRPTRLDPSVEDRIISAVRGILPAGFQTPHPR